MDSPFQAGGSLLLILIVFEVGSSAGATSFRLPKKMNYINVLISGNTLLHLLSCNLDIILDVSVGRK
jgi:hypothetical protein